MPGFKDGCLSVSMVWGLLLKYQGIIFSISYKVRLTHAQILPFSVVLFGGINSVLLAQTRTKSNSRQAERQRNTVSVSYCGIGIVLCLLFEVCL